MDALDIYLEDSSSLSLDEFRERHGDRFLLKTPEGDPASWDDAMQYQTVVVASGADPVGPLDRLPDFSTQWGLFLVQKSPDNPFPERISVGRARSCDVVLRLSFVSKLHAHFLVDAAGQSLRLVDQNSANGTRLNGKALEPSKPVSIQVGDRVGFGPTFELTYLDAGALYRRLSAM